MPTRLCHSSILGQMPSCFTRLENPWKDPEIHVEKKTNLLNPSPRSLRVMWRVYVCVLRLEISSNIAPCLGELFTRNLSSWWVSSTVKEFTKAKKNEKKKYPENVPFLIMMLFEEHDKNWQNKALPLRPKQKKTWPFRPFPNENAPWIHPGDGFLKRGQAASTAEICFWWVGHLKRGGSPWRSTAPPLDLIPIHPTLR